MKNAYPSEQGLYDPKYEHESCGVGFVVDIKGRRSHGIVLDALKVLANLDHRGARGAEENSGDGAGILMQIPDLFLRESCSDLDLPAVGEYAAGMVFLRDENTCADWLDGFKTLVEEEGQVFLGSRIVPTDDSSLGRSAKAFVPIVLQLFVGRGENTRDESAFARKLYVIRRRCELESASCEDGPGFYVCSLSQRTIVYKGMLTPLQLPEFFPELTDPRVESALALVHSRFSTNTFPSWERAHPYRYIIHNGEINTLRGNVNWMRAREALLKSDLFGDDLGKVLPIINENGSDSGMFDNCLEFLVLSGRSLPHAVMMMVPPPWVQRKDMDDELRAFYQFHSCLMEPWDGPASVAFTDGRLVGAILDRNGLRPSRYYITRDDRVVMASEVGVLDIPPDQVAVKGRLKPGEMFLIDTEAGRIVSDDEIKKSIASEHPYRKWLDDNLLPLESLTQAPSPKELDVPNLTRLQHAFGYTHEDLRLVLEPMGRAGDEPVGSMGVDTPLAILSDTPQLLYSYFKQLFAQVTNPPIDSIREELVTSLETVIGSKRNLLDPSPESCRQIALHRPVLTDSELATLKAIDVPGSRVCTLPILFDPSKGGDGLRQALDELFANSEKAIDEGASILILSDRGVDACNAPIPALLAVSGLHHHLTRVGKRMRCGLVLESGEPREVHHYALLVGYGLGAVNPYVALDTIADMVRRGMLGGVSLEKAEANYVKAAVKGIVKTMSKMGISVVQSYRGAQIFEALGIRRDVVDMYFAGTPTRIGGVGLDEIAEETVMRLNRAFPDSQPWDSTLDSGGDRQWRANGEDHIFNPESIYLLQTACRTGSYDRFGEYSRLMNDQTRGSRTLRGMLELGHSANPIPLEEVEPVESIVVRFKTGAMSYGSISKEAHEALAIAMNRLGGKSNTGEGGEDARRLVPGLNGDIRSSAIKQVASGRFGVTSHYLATAREIQIKMAQGAKPGEGGQLPGSKVYPWIAKTRYSTPGVQLISPPPHHDIYSIEDLAQLIFDLKNANRDARISVKLVSEAGVGTVAAGVTKAGADVILISGHDGGTGASPRSSIRYAGLPWELGLAETHQTLVLNNLRGRVVLETDGKLLTGRDVVIATLLGAEEFGFSTGPLVALGCVMMRVCHIDTCPMGIATQNPDLRKSFKGDPDYVVNFMRFVAQEVRELMAQLGFRTLDEMVGRTDLLRLAARDGHRKSAGVDLSSLLYAPRRDMADVPSMSKPRAVHDSLDVRRLLPMCSNALRTGQRIDGSVPVHTTDRTIGTILGCELSKKHGEEGLTEDTISLRFTGSAGQSFGAFIPRGISLTLEGDSNDYIGKGLSGGKIIVYPPKESVFAAEENIIIGNVAFYGATGGEAYIRGIAGERFCVRNSGVKAVVEGVGDHGCEYMTGGRVAVIGSTGRNFAAGMTGGIAYVFDENGRFADRCNCDTVQLEGLECPEEIELLRMMIVKHSTLTGSTVARRLLDDWDNSARRFVKVMPKDYKRMIEAIARAMERGLFSDDAVLAAFEDTKAAAAGRHL